MVNFLRPEKEPQVIYFKKQICNHFATCYFIRSYCNHYKKTKIPSPLVNMLSHKSLNSTPKRHVTTFPFKYNYAFYLHPFYCLS